MYIAGHLLGRFIFTLTLFFFVALCRSRFDPSAAFKKLFSRRYLLPATLMSATLTVLGLSSSAQAATGNPAIADLLDLDGHKKQYIQNYLIPEADFRFALDLDPIWESHNLQQGGKHFMVAVSPDDYVPRMVIQTMPHSDMTTKPSELKTIAETAFAMSFKQYSGKKGSISKLVRREYDNSQGYLGVFRGRDGNRKPVDVVVYIGLGNNTLKVAATHFEVQPGQLKRARFVVERYLNNSGYIDDFDPVITKALRNEIKAGNFK